MENRVLKFVLKIFKNKTKKDNAYDHFHLSKKFIMLLGLSYNQSNLRRRVGLIIFVALQFSVMVPQVMITTFYLLEYYFMFDVIFYDSTEQYHISRNYYTSYITKRCVLKEMPIRV